MSARQIPPPPPPPPRFYTLLVISTALFNKPPYKNLIVNGLVLAADGQKMSKRLRNYPDPVEVVKKFGADALRLYLVNSPVVRAETLRFQEKGVKDVVKDVFLPWFNAYRFLIQNVQRLEQVSVCMCVRHSVCLSVTVSVCMCVCLYVCPSQYVCLYVFPCMCVCLSVCVSVCVLSSVSFPSCRKRVCHSNMRRTSPPSISWIAGSSPSHSL